MPIARPLSRFLAALLLAAPIAAQAPARAARPDARRLPTRAEVARLVDSAAMSFVRQGVVPSIALAVVRGRDTLVHRAYGMADLEHDIAATPAHVYRTGSITKQFTAAGIMRLVEQGKVGLDDDFTRYIRFDTRGRTVTVRQLLNHTSGIRSYTGSPAWRRRWREDMAPDTIVALVAPDSFDFAPGTSWSYNNTGYVLLGMIIEKISGKPYATFVEEELFRPLGLAATSYCETRPLIRHRARGYERAGDGFVNAEYLSMSQPYAAGSICSTVGDLVKWNAALVSGRVVRAASYALMAGPSTQLDGRPIENGYGFGLAMRPFGERRAVSHSGGIHGFSSDMAWLPDDSVLVVALTNAGSPAAGRIIRIAAAAALGDPIPGAARATLSEADRARYAGTYRLTMPNGNAIDVRVWSEGGQLRAHPAGQQQVTLVPQGEHAFVDSTNPNIALRFTLEGGRATKFAITQGGRTSEAPRVP